MANKLNFYAESLAAYILPKVYYRQRLSHIMQSLTDDERVTVMRRAEYYVRIPRQSIVNDFMTVGKFRYPLRDKHKYATYFFDLYETVRYFPPMLRFHYLFGDITYEPSVATFVKSREITLGETNSAILKLNKVRHFRFVDDMLNFRDKRNMLVSRNVVTQPQRKLLLEKYLNHPMCDVGQINYDTAHPEWQKEYLTIRQQLQYKFVSCIEGMDVATNLKWVMSSNSLAVMPRPKYETWFMEGTLIPDYHYVEIKPDYSDLEEKMSFYIRNPHLAEKIISNAHEYIKQFEDPKIERATGIAAAMRYFELTNQTEGFVYAG